MQLSHGPVDRSRRVRACPRGFTLIELMVTLAVVAIVAALATPSFTGVINSNRLTSQANELVADIQLARSEALRRNRTVRLCRSTDGSTCAAGAGKWTGWVVRTQGANAELLRSYTVKGALQVSGGTDVDFRADGLARSAAGGLLATTFTICLPTTRPAENVRRVELTGGSRVKSAAATHSTPGSCPQ